MSTLAARAAGQPKLHAVTLGELLDHRFAPRQDLITPWLRQRESALIWAPSGLGKSLLACTIALAVAGGGEVLGWESPKPRPVYLVDGEMDVEDLQERLGELIGTVGGIDVDAARRNLNVLARQGQHPNVDFPDIATEQGQKLVLREARKHKAELVILDNFSTLAMVDDENSAAAMNPMQECLLKLKQARIATIMVHHANKGGKELRGSTKIETTFNVIIGMTKPESGEARHGAHFNLSWGKYRRKRCDAVSDVTMSYTSDPEGRPMWHKTETEDAKLDALVALIRSCEYPTQAALAEQLGVAQGTASKWLRKAIAQRSITAAEAKECMAAAGEECGEENPDF